MKRMRRDRGSALIISTIITLVVSAMAAAYFTMSFFRSKTAFSDSEGQKALYLAESGIAVALSQLNDDDGAKPGDGDIPTAQTIAGSTNVDDIRREGAFTVVRDDIGPPPGPPSKIIRLTATGEYGGDAFGSTKNSKRQIEVVMQAPVPPTEFNGLGSVVSNGKVSVTGNIEIDGRDWLMDGSGLNPNSPTSDQIGVVTTKTFEHSGSAMLGGKGVAPHRPPPPSKNTPYTDGVEYDSEYSYPGGFPADEDEAFGVPPGTVRAAAGTVYTNPNAMAAAMAADPGGGKIWYLDLSGGVWNAATFQPTMNTNPSVLVMKGDMKNLHCNFKGLIIANSITHINAATRIYGSILCQSTTGNVLGNGSAIIRFSQEALDNLPSVATSGQNYRILSWRELTGM